MRIQTGAIRRTVVVMLSLWRERRLSVAAAGLAYHLTLSVFPTLICLQTALGGLFPAGETLRGFLAVVFPPDTVRAILDYLRYASANHSNAMLTMALALAATSSAAAFRTVEKTIGDLRGVHRLRGLTALAFSFCASLFFLAAICLAVILIATGKWYLALAERRFLFLNLSESWSCWRFALLFLLLFVMCAGLYRMTAPRDGGVRLLPGALGASSALFVSSFAFSACIGAGAKYPLVYGSLAGIVVVMLWFYTCGVILFLGGAMNVALERCTGRGDPD